MIFPWEQLKATTHMVFHVKERNTWELPLRQNDFAALWFILKGNIRLFVRNEWVQVQEGEVLLLPPDTPFAAKMGFGCPYARIVVVRFTLHLQYGSNRLDWLRLYQLPILHMGQTTRIAKRDMLRLLTVYRSPSPLKLLRVNSLLDLLLGAIIETNLVLIQPIETSDNRRFIHVFRIIRWMHEHLVERTSLGQLASLIPMSVDHLNDLFNTVTGMSCMHYLSDLRLQKAKDLLRQSALPVAEISRLVGIEDPHYFSRLFKKAEGTSPTQYRKHMLDL